MSKFLLDTNILMSTEDYEKLFEDYKDCELVLSSVVIEELDHIKTREGVAGFQARRAIKSIYKHMDKFTFYADGLDDKADNKIIKAACDSTMGLLTNDVNVQLKAKAFFNTEVEAYNQEKKQVKPGYVMAKIDAIENFVFPTLLYGEYLIVETDEKNHIYKSYGEGQFDEIFPQNLGNVLETISPKDCYQVCAIDSLVTDNFTIITGKAGSGKTLLSLTYALREIYSGKRRKLVIFVNPVKTFGSEVLGFYTGSRTEKLMQNSIGAILTSKLCGLELVDSLMEEGRLEILPISDIRGYEVGQEDIMYITEAQNLNVELIKLAIQRCATNTKIILEGDPTTQVDHYSFAGDGNGMLRTIDVFEGFYKFSHVDLPHIYRSEMAERAELL